MYLKKRNTNVFSISKKKYLKNLGEVDAGEKQKNQYEYE